MPESLADAADALDPALRARIVDRWTSAALDEHASVASFSRFSLHLLAVGAPPELLDGAHQAARDEIRHAKLCFDVASTLAGEPLGPGPVPLDGDLLGPLDLPSIAAMAAIEGCVGETVAAHEAQAAHDAAGPEEIRRALAVIARDEARHAALAWSFVTWALAAGGPPVRRALATAFARALAPLPDTLPQPGDDVLARFGRFGAADRLRLRRQALAEVVGPAVAALGR